MNKKQLIVTSILVSLMFVLVIAQNFFTENFEKINYADNSINECTQYQINNKKCVISIPSKWSVEEKNNEDAYISQTLKFRSDNQKINGILEVINTTADTAAFANEDFEKQSLDYRDSKTNSYKYKDNIGVLIEYNTSIKNGYKYKNQCYYIKLSENQIIKILFNVKDEGKKESSNEIINSIISSIKQDK